MRRVFQPLCLLCSHLCTSHTSLIGRLPYASIGLDSASPRPLDIQALTTNTGRYLYMVGYTADANKRYGKGGAIHWIGFLTGLISSGKLAYDLVNAK